MREKVLAGRYVLVEQIGVGGMAIVYRAIDRNTGHSVAVKVLKPEYNRDAEFVSRFQREAEAASKMIHHNIVNLLDVGMDGENRFLIMEHVRGKTLKEVIQEKGRINPQTAVQIAIRILSALQHAHQNGIIHRDIKPQNILMNADGHVKVADFGIARMANSSTLTRGDSVMGSVHYFSPEQAQGQGTDVTSDLYSVGVTLYEMLTGRVPFDGDSPVAIAMQHLHAQPEPIQRFAPDVPDAICHVCLKAMEKNPAYRYASAREMATELRKALHGQVDQLQPRLVPAVRPPVRMAPVQGAAPSRVRQTTARNRIRRSRIRMALMSLVVLAVVVYGLALGTSALYERLVNSVTVGYYENSQYDEARRAIERSGLQVEMIPKYDANARAGVVIKQLPLADTRLHKGDTVTLTVSQGPESQKVPNVVGMSYQNAMNELEKYGLKYEIVERVQSNEDVAMVIRQVPQAETYCQPGDKILLTVQGGTSVVPDVEGAPLDEARTRMIEAGLTLNPVIEYRETSEASRHGTVAEQSIPPGTVDKGRLVTLTVWVVPSMQKKADYTLSLPDSDGKIRVRIMLRDDIGEVQLLQLDVPSNASRYPKVELEWLSEGAYKILVYIDNAPKATDQVRFE